MLSEAVPVIERVQDMHPCVSSVPLMERGSKYRRYLWASWWRRFSYTRFACELVVATVMGTAVASPLMAPAERPVAAESRLGVVDSIVQAAVRDKLIPGAVVLIGHDGQVVYRKAFGSRSLDPNRQPMTVDTIFDLASLT